MIDIENSFIYFIGLKNNWRANVKSIVYLKDKTFILTKECRSEIISSSNPFQLLERNEVMALVEDDQVYLLRNHSGSLNQKNEITKEEKIKAIKNLSEKNFNALDFDKCQELISSKKLKNIICKLEFKFNNENFTLITKCEYINFNKRSNKQKYLQPIMGYVPFILNGKIKIAYIVCNLNKEKNSDIFFILREKTPFFSIKKKSFFKNLLYKILKIIFFPIKKKEFTKVVRIKVYKLSLFGNS